MTCFNAANVTTISQATLPWTQTEMYGVCKNDAPPRGNTSSSASPREERLQTWPEDQLDILDDFEVSKKRHSAEITKDQSIFESFPPAIQRRYRERP